MPPNEELTMWTIAQNTSPGLPITIRNGSLTLQTGVLVAALRWQIAGGSLTAAAGTLTESTGAATGNYTYQPAALETATVGLCLLSHAALTVSPGEIQVVAASSDAYLTVTEALALAAGLFGKRGVPTPWRLQHHRRRYPRWVLCVGALRGHARLSQHAPLTLPGSPGPSCRRG
jgi:hypothetical protein